MLLEAVIRRGGIGQVLKVAQVGSITGTTLVSLYYYGNSSGTISTGTLRGLKAGLWRPSNATGIADDWRPCGDVNGSTGAVTVATWADTTLGTEDFYQLNHGLHPQQVIDAMNRALRRCYFENMEPLSTKPSGAVLADAGFQSTATTSYTESDVDSGPATTFTKVTTANSENVFRGIGSGRVVNAATGGYIRQRFNVTPGEQVIWHALSRRDVGTNAEAVLYDISNSAAIGTTVEHSQEAWQWMRRSETVPSGCKILETRLQGEGASDDIYWNATCLYLPSHRLIHLDTTWDTSFKMPSLVYCTMGGVSAGTGIFPAHAAELQPIPADAYDFLIERPGANPYAVQMHDTRYFNYPIYIDGRRAYSDLTTFTRAMTETTSCDVDLLEAATRLELFSDRNVHVPDQAVMRAEAERDFRAQGSLNLTEGLAMKQRMWAQPRLRN